KDQEQIGEFYAEEIRRWIGWGYTAEEVLQAATRIGAEAAGLGDRVGTLTVGKRADIIVVPGDAVQDPASVVRPSWVIQDGKVLRQRQPSSLGATVGEALTRYCAMPERRRVRRPSDAERAIQDKMWGQEHRGRL
ncbi:MAG: amidohydrolase family protein, partial [Vicinamibacteria bacterium]